MQIQCPHCSAKLQLGAPKPGRYKPKCKKCGQAFLMRVGEGDPPPVQVAAPKANRPNPDSTKTKADSVSPADAAHTEAARKSAVPTEASLTKAAVEETIDQTVDAASVPSSAPAAVSKGVSGRSPSSDANPVSDAKSAAVAQTSAGDEIRPAPTRLGGYRIIRMLGRGAMGAVYQAKQISLDRDVALKTIRGRLADNPASLARFTREAYAAAQLSHHNVVQIYDFGEDDGQHFFSMEWIRGGSLGDLVGEKGCIDPKLAATYILQAARGLQFAHQCGMVHRDVKPANLLLGDDGVVKVADLGLVKIPDQVDTEPLDDGPSRIGLQSGTQVTMQGTAVGTPAYMAPEQSDDASTVDHRADIYSLGCSLFYLLAGHSPYAGSVASEVIEKHASAPLPNLAEINSRVPEPLCEIVSRSMAKRPSDRYGSLAEMIHDLQSFLGVETLTGFSPSSDQADRWESLASAYAKSQTLTRFAGSIFWAFVACSVLMTLVSTWISLRAVLLGPTMLSVGCVTAILFGATAGQSVLSQRLRRWVGTLSWIELAGGVLASVILLLVVFVGGLWPGVLIGAVIGAAAGAGYHFAITTAAQKLGSEPLENARRFVRDLRIQGADEDGLRDFLARYAGKGWQSIYEALFGYDALVDTRSRLALDPAFSGPVGDQAIRDRICAILAKRAQTNRESADREKLAKLERKALVSQGVSESEAREQSWQMASAIMETAQVTAEKNVSDERQIAEAKRKRIKAMLADARSGRYKRPHDRFRSVKLALSGFSRLLAGCLLLAAFVFAARSQGLLDEGFLDEVRSGEIVGSLPGDATTDALGESTSLWSLGIAGVLLCLSAFVSGWRMTPFAIVATLVILFGANWGVPGFGPAESWMVAAAIGVVVYVPGYLFGETRT